MAYQLNILLCVLVVGLIVQFYFTLLMWYSVNIRLNKLQKTFDKIDKEITDSNRRICHIQGVFSSPKDFILSKEES